MSLFLVLSTKTGYATRIMDSLKEICIHEYWGNKTIWVLGFVKDPNYVGRLYDLLIFNAKVLVKSLHS